MIELDNDDHRRPVIPPAEAVECQPIRAAIESWETAKQATRIAEQTAAEQERTREVAVAQDRDRYATALEKGKGIAPRI